MRISPRPTLALFLAFALSAPIGAQQIARSNFQYQIRIATEVKATNGTVTFEVVLPSPAKWN
jgi:hypothetical protein